MGQGLDTPIQTAGHAGASPEVARRRLSGVQAVVVSGRYAFIGQRPTSGTLIDEQTGKRTVLSAPAGCSFTYFGFGETAALGAPWVVAACNPPRLYQLYNIPARAWTPLSSDPSRLFAFNADCKTGDPECVASYTAVGTRWIEFRIICGDHCGQATTYAFQNIQTGQVRDQPPDWKPGGTEIPDLNSPALTRKLCRPLRVLSGFFDQRSYVPALGPIAFYGQFAIARQWSAGNVRLSTYVERCGSRARTSIDPNGWPVAANAQTVIWMTGFGNPMFAGLFLPALGPFTLTRPALGSLPAVSATHIYATHGCRRPVRHRCPAGAEAVVPLRRCRVCVPPRRTSLRARGRVRGGAALTGRGSRCVRCPGAVRAGDPRSRGERGAGFSRRST